MGKTTLAAEWPDTVFLQTEDGENTSEIETFGLMTSYDHVLEVISCLYNDDHNFKNLAIDTVDRIEPLIQAACCEANSWANITSPGYGEGYAALDLYWQHFLAGLDALRSDRKMCITLIAHSEIGRFDDPRTSSYSRYDIRLHKRALAMICNNMDVICFLNQEPVIKEEKQGYGKTRSIGNGGIQRYMYLEGRPSMNAGNRLNMPEKLPYMKGKGYEMLAPYFPHVNGGKTPTAAPAPTVATKTEPETKPTKTAGLKKLETVSKVA